ncbi:nitronate monooxygenase family protein [Aquihabitans sp. G128]|uniref:NAD(P)H-dependent flavin oxidoreductase n=1 Tax=Aquihabitans sp. G128 TaxID=2849779 RepID=UPI001C233779|nr:nitronate monooxygenase family protein [Aquihabitans sp. G128]QXC59997.1 nitronate monooxygenase family protein [Aquihabitans sp. G128]
MRTKATELVGIDVPIFAFSHCRDVVAAVTNAGGLGVLGAVAHSPEQLAIDLDWIEAEVGAKPYGIDLLVPEKFVGAEEGGFDRTALQGLLPDAHKEWVDDLLERYGVPPLPEGLGGGRGLGGMRVDPKSMAPLLDVCFDHRPRLLASALGPPPAHFLERAHAADVPVAALAGTVEHAAKHAAAGADLIVAQGTEAGGHTGLIATMVLVPAVVDAVGPTPVLAAGGIASGRQLAAGMALGADGAWCGSVWLTTEEAETPPAIKAKFLAAGPGDTVRSRSMTGKPARMLRTAWTDEWERADGPGPLPMPIQPLLIGPAMARIGRVADKAGTGANDLATYFIGQVVGSLDTVKPTRRVVLEMVEEFIDAVERLGGFLTED